ncbi:MAG: dipeptide epimerase [Gemmatimonadaceae bacterium]
MKVVSEIVTVRTRHPFVIARGGASEYRVVSVRVIDADGSEGWGEASPSPYYGETAETVVDALGRMAPLLAQADAWSIDAVEARLAAAVPRNASARAAVSAAWHDLAGKRLGVPVWKLWGLDPATAPRSSFTIAIVPDHGMLRERVAEAGGYPILKIKLGTDQDEAIVRTVRSAAPGAVLRVDANAAWRPRQAVEMTHMLAEHGVEFVEQPVAPADIEGLRFVRERSALPIIADESCLVAHDIPRLVGAVDGINIKLAKCGGLREALRMIATARAHHLLVMAGCMIETSLGITAAAQLAPLLDYADLDGAALLAEDPWRGATISGGVIRLPTAAGLGVATTGGRSAG